MTERVRLLRVFLQEARFAEKPPAEVPAPRRGEVLGFGTQLEVSRPAALELVVALTFSGDEGLPYRFLVTYAAGYELDGSVPAAERDEAWLDAAATRAPALLYPYVRELVANLTARRGDLPLLLPEIPGGLDFSGSELRIPPPPDPA
ncbi:MAG TPA: hypothetical protein VFX98_09120 [Longimicrobiaceae bacterium]|nr:hypothetical protein [Longimicrobiaceae bacterium]